MDNIIEFCTPRVELSNRSYTNFDRLTKDQYIYVIKLTGIPISFPHVALCINLEILSYSCDEYPEGYFNDWHNFAVLQKLSQLSFFYNNELYYISYLCKKRDLIWKHDEYALIFKNSVMDIILDKAKTSVICYKPFSITSSICIELTITIYIIFDLIIPDTVKKLTINYRHACPLATYDEIMTEINQYIATSPDCVVSII
jgi:hypothetical protein